MWLALQFRMWPLLKTSVSISLVPLKFIFLGTALSLGSIYFSFGYMPWSNVSWFTFISTAWYLLLWDFDFFLCYLVQITGLCQVDREKVIAMKHTLETLDKRNTTLIKSLTTACKVKGEPSCMDSISLVTNHLKKKSFCQLLCRDMQVFTFPLYYLSMWGWKV